MANPNQNVRDRHGRYSRNPETATRDAAAAELRTKGLTYQQIANELGYASTRSAWEAVQRAIHEVIQGPAEALLTLHMERLETLYDAALEVLGADHVMVSHGKVITMPDEDGVERPLKDHAPKLAAIREARQTLDAFWNLTGMKQPAKVEHSGGVTYEIVGVSPEDVV